MLLSLITMTTFSLCLSLTMCSTPLSMALWVVLLALSSATIVSLYASSWFGIMVFLIYVGGMLVMFAYFLAIQPNQQMGLNFPILLLVLTMLTLLLTQPLNSSTHLYNPYWLSSLINFINIPIMIILALTLFLALLMVVKVVSIEKGPLRPYN